MRTKLVAAVALVLLVLTPAAWAHVEVEPKETPKGSTATFTFSVPNEDAAASTVSIEILFPNGVTFSTVSPAAKSGWTTMPGASSVTWSGGKIAGENKEQFTVTLGPLPNDETVTFKAIQTYDNGTVVRWIGAAGTDNPAPVVTLTGAPVTTTSTTVVNAVTTTVAPKPEAEEKGEKSNATTFLIAGAMLLAGIGAGIAVAARRRGAPKP